MAENETVVRLYLQTIKTLVETCAGYQRDAHEAVALLGTALHGLDDYWSEQHPEFVAEVERVTGQKRT
jgi:hypothetical protein